MSNVSEIQAAIDKYLDNFGGEESSAPFGNHLLGQVKALLSSHAVIDKETAQSALFVLDTEGFHDDAREFRDELLRIHTHKGK